MSVDLSPFMDDIRENAPVIFAVLGGPCAAAAVGALCFLFGVTPDKLVNAMENEHRNQTLKKKLQNAHLL